MNDPGYILVVVVPVPGLLVPVVGPVTPPIGIVSPGITTLSGAGVLPCSALPWHPVSAMKAPSAIALRDGLIIEVLLQFLVRMIAAHDSDPA